MARLAQSQATYCAKVNRLVHSSRYAFRGGENLAQRGIPFLPRSIVNCWLKSKAGHREYLLSSRVTKAGVGIAKSKGQTFVAWAFSDEQPSYPDCPSYRNNKISKTGKIITKNNSVSNYIILTIITIVLAFLVYYFLKYN